MKSKANIGETTIPTSTTGGHADLSRPVKKSKKPPSKTKRAKPAGLGNLEARWSIGFVLLFAMLFLVVIGMKLVMEYRAAREDILYSRVFSTTNYAEQVRSRIQEVTARLDTTAQMLAVSPNMDQATTLQFLRILETENSIQAISLLDTTTNEPTAIGSIASSTLTAVLASISKQNLLSGVAEDMSGKNHIFSAIRIKNNNQSSMLIALISPNWLQGTSSKKQINLIGDKNGNLFDAATNARSISVAGRLGMNADETSYHIRTRLIGGLEGKSQQGQRLAVGVVTLFQGNLVVFQAGELKIDNAAWTRTLVFFLLMTIAPLMVATVLVISLLNQMNGLQNVRQKLSDSDARFRLAIEGARSGVFDWDLNNNQVLLTDSLARMFGLKRGATISGNEFMALVHSADRKALHSALRDAPTSGAIDIEFRASSLPVWFQARGRPWQGQGDRNSGRIVGVAIDITEQKGAQARLNAAETRLRAALESMSESFVVWDAKRRLIMCNRKFSEFFGIAPKYLVSGVSYEELELMAARSIKDIHEGRDSSTVEMELTDGRWLHLSERKTAEGGLVSIGTDITAIKMQESLLVKNEAKLISTVSDLEVSQNSYQQEKIRAEEANRSKSEFLANMSHELRTPLNAINGFSEIMKKEMFGPLGDQRYLEYVGDILTSGQHLLNLINDILDMSKIESGKMTLSTEVLYFDEMVDQCLRLVRGKAIESDVQLDADVADLPDIEADPRAIKQILLNVLSNAIKFTLPDGHVNLTTKTDAETGGIILQVVDTGIGISKEDLPKLCTPFSQIESQHSKSHKGSGLGLALTKSLVELHGGEFIIESEVGTGTTVTVKLPLAPPKNESENADKEPPIQSIDVA